MMMRKVEKSKLISSLINHFKDTWALPYNQTPEAKAFRAPRRTIEVR